MNESHTTEHGERYFDEYEADKEKFDAHIKSLIEKAKLKKHHSPDDARELEEEIKRLENIRDQRFPKKDPL